MNWLKTALTITQLAKDSFYTVVDPYDFYEWRYKEIVPAGTKVSKYLPPTDIIATGQIIACVSIPEHSIEHGTLKQDVNVVPIVKVGQIPSANELRTRYSNICKTFSSGLEQFRNESKVVKFYVGTDYILRKVSYINMTQASIEDFGKFSDIMEMIKSKREELKKKADIKEGRAHEMADFFKYSQALIFVDELKLHGNSEKMNYLITVANVVPNTKRSVSWNDCYLEICPAAKENYNLINSLGKKAWLSSFISSATNLSRK